MADKCKKFITHNLIFHKGNSGEYAQGQRILCAYRKYTNLISKILLCSDTAQDGAAGDCYGKSLNSRAILGGNSEMG